MSSAQSTRASCAMTGLQEARARGGMNTDSVRMAIRCVWTWRVSELRRQTQTFYCW